MVKLCKSCGKEIKGREYWFGDGKKCYKCRGIKPYKPIKGKIEIERKPYPLSLTETMEAIIGLIGGGIFAWAMFSTQQPWWAIIIGFCAGAVIILIPFKFWSNITGVYQRDTKNEIKKLRETISKNKESNSLKIIKERYAKGKITKKEYLEMKKDLN